MVTINWRIWSRNHIHKKPWQCCWWCAPTPQSVCPSNNKISDSIRIIVCDGLHLSGALRNGLHLSRYDAPIISNDAKYQNKNKIVQNKFNTGMLKMHSFCGTGSRNIELSNHNSKVYIPKPLHNDVIGWYHKYLM